MKQASKLVWLRHKPVVILTVVLAVLLLAFNVKNNYDNYRYTERNAMTAQNFEKHRKDWGYKRGEFAKYQRDTFSMVQQGDDVSPIPDTQAGPKVFAFIIITLAALGLFVAGWDGQSQFNRYLFGVGVRRRDVYWAKIRLYLPLVAGVIVAETAGPLLAAKAYIPARFYDLTLAQGALMVGYNLLLALTGFMVAFFVATVFTRPVVAVLGTGVLIWFTNVAFMNIGFFTSQQNSDAVYAGGFDQPGPMFFWGAGFAMLVTLVTLALSAWSYRHLSLDSEGELLYLPQLRWPIVLVAMVVMFFTFMNQTGEHSFSWSMSIAAAVIVFALGLLWQYWAPLRARYRKFRHFA